MLPKRSSDNYLKIRKTITNKEVLNIVLVLSKELFIKPHQVIDRFISEGAQKEINKRKINDKL